MPQSVVITIGVPILINGEEFNVEIVDANGNVITAGTATNDPFTVNNLNAGEYTCIVHIPGTEDSCNTSLCFTVTDTTCTCPTISSAVFAPNENGINYFNAAIDLPDGIAGCGLIINWESADGSDSGAITYTNANQLTLSEGTIYQITLYLGALEAYNVQVILDCCNGQILKCSEYSFTLNPTGTGGTGACTGNQLSGQIIPTLIRDGSDNIYISLHIPVQSIAPPYDNISVTFLELYGCDSDAVPITLPGTTPPYDYIVPHELMPCVPWTNQYGGLYHNQYAINVYSCDGTILLGEGQPTAPAP